MGASVSVFFSGDNKYVIASLYFQEKVGSIDGRRMVHSFVLTLGISSLMGIVAYQTANLMELVISVNTKLGQLLQVGVSITIGVLVFGFLAIFLKMEEGEMVKKILLRRFRKAPYS